jgi:type IV pilus biogenesis protein CpaD/CtpE
MARILFLVGLAGTLVLSGCSLSPQFDRQFGSSVQQALAQQTLDPQAVNNRAPVTGMDGKTAESVYENYQKSFRTPEAQGSSLTTGSSTR